MKVEFYILASGGENERLRKACELTEQSWRNGERVWLTAHDEAQAQLADQTLWTFRQDSFVPHERHTPRVEADVRVRVALASELSEACTGVVVNLAAQALPVTPSDAYRVIEIVAGHEDSRRAGRERYRQYRDAGCTLNTVSV